VAAVVVAPRLQQQALLAALAGAAQAGTTIQPTQQRAL